GLVFGLTLVGESARGHALVTPWVPVLVGAAALAVFVARQLRLQDDGNALLDLRPFGHRPFVLAMALVVLSMMSLFGVLILLPLYLQDVLGISPFVTGLAVLPGGLAMGLLGPVVGRLYDRLGPRRLVVPGAAVLTCALWAFTTLGTTSPLWMVVVFHVVLVLGISLMLTPLMTDALGRLPGHLDSHGSAIMATLQQVAGAAGTALFVTVMAVASAGATAGTDVVGARVAFTVAAIIATAALPLTLLVGRGKHEVAAGPAAGATRGAAGAGARVAVTRPATSATAALPVALLVGRGKHEVAAEPAAGWGARSLPAARAAPPAGGRTRAGPRQGDFTNRG